MSEDKGNRPWRGAAPSQTGRVDTLKCTGDLDTNHLKVAAAVAFQTGNRVRVCNDDRCVDVVPDHVVTEIVANGEPFRPTWLVIHATRQFPGRTAYVYDAGDNRGVAA